VEQGYVLIVEDTDTRASEGDEPMKLYTKISIGLLAGIIAGWLLGSKASYLEPFGEAFIRLITMVVVPLIFASLTVGAASLGDLKKLGRIGVKSLGYFILTTAVALVIGIFLATLLQPGVGLSEDTKTELLQNYHGDAQERIQSARKPNLVNILLYMIPTNPLSAMAKGEMLAIIFFALVFGVTLSLIPKEKAQPMVGLMESLNEIMMKIVQLVMHIAPYGVFALMASIVGQFGPGIILLLGKYAMVVLLALLIHLTVTYSLLVVTLGRLNPLTFFRAIFEAQLIAFGTSSSNATLPVTMNCCQKNLNISKEVSSFVLPLGATVNMDGTALYQGVAAIFIAQIYGMDLTFADQLLIVLTATLSSIGAAGVPGAGMITLTLVLRSVGIPLTGIALILGVDRILDMCRTAVNITGDASCALFIDRSEKGSSRVK